MRPDLLKFVMGSTSWMESTTEFKIRIWSILNNIKEQKHCKTCNSLIKEKVLGEWKVYCNKTCQYDDETLSDQIKERAKKRNVEEANQRREETNIKKFGVPFMSQRPEVKKLIRDKSRDRILNPIAKAALDDKQWLIDQHVIQKKNVTKIADEIGCYYEAVINALNFHEIEFTPDVEGISGDSLFQQSVFEFVKSIYSGKILYKDRTLIQPKEVDIYLPEAKLAIECNGLYHHSTGPNGVGKGSTYHKDKKDRISDSGVSLMMVNECDWNFNRPIVESMILSRLGKTEKIYARKTDVRFIDTKTRKDFFEANHINGDAGASIQIGLFYNGELVSCMSFSKPRFSKDVDFELIRFATKLNTTVVGGGSKIIRFFKINFSGSIGTYADRMYGDGSAYTKIGFKYERTTEPGYYWTDKVKLFNRMSFMKKNLLKLFPEVNPTMSESEIMFMKKYRKFYDCGHNYFVLQ